MILLALLAGCGPDATMYPDGGTSGTPSDARTADATAAGDGASVADAGGQDGAHAPDSASGADAARDDSATPGVDAGSGGTAGCGSAPPGDAYWSLEHDGRTRSFKVHLPAGYDRDTPHALVLSFHGRATTASLQELVSGFSDAADSQGFVVVYPEGTGAQQTWNAGYCCGEAQSANVDDVGFTAAMIDRLEAALCIDPARIYANGLSNGGFFAYRLACELDQRIAAIGSVAGVTVTIPCNPSRPVPVQHFHGTNDQVVDYYGTYGLSQLSAPDNAQAWADRNGCDATPSVRLEIDDVRCEVWGNCDGGVEVELCTITDGGHQWPGGWEVPGLGTMSNTISATDEMWQFFSRFRLP